MSVKVYIADNSNLFRDILLARLSGAPEIEFIGHARNAAEVFSSLRYLEPEVVILGSRFSDNRGLDVLKKIKKSHPTIKVIILAHNADDEEACRFFNAGAEFLVDKSSDVEHIVSLFKTLH